MTVGKSASPERWHANEVARWERRGEVPRRPAHVDPFESCPVCAKARAVCARKIRLADWAEAQQWVDDFNHEHRYVNPVIRYPCRWCRGYHMKTARQPGERRIALRAHRKWLLKQREVTDA